MKIVVTNDDGYDHPGLAVLVEAVAMLGETTVAAPAIPQSNVGHRVTMREPILVDQSDEGTYVVHATPADCVRLAVKQWVPDVDWIFAGVNQGANLGTDVYQSGTVAAAREAAILGIRAAAVSQYIAADQTVDWPAAQAHTTRCLAEILQRSLRPGKFWNINLPSPLRTDSTPQIRFCPLDTHPHHYRYTREEGNYRYRGIIHNRPRTLGSDVDVCFKGEISMTRMEI